MSELEYQRALLKKAKQAQADKDLELARQLQEQFNNEEQIERPTGNLYYKAPTNLNSSKCLVDPSWEVIDPTPDITVLFIAFSRKFFWDSLGSVTVAWSKRMTTCAGICSYQGRGGMCSITLSEPLLKLRPRKDLVETLLHEMIHAYLFLTDNDRDRDGHGPNFHKHMYRINAEAGTNISVYHNFHDEVRLYQQHWWKCDGPCQQRKPYFGMVKRAMNRAPGPNDRWWGDHQTSCGGSFIKVKSPEKVEKKKESTKQPPVKPSNGMDIRKYFPKSPVAEKPSKSSTKIHTVSTIAKGNEVGQVISSKSNIHGFTKTISSGSKSNTQKNVSSIKEVVPSTSITVFSGEGRSLKTNASSPLKDYAVVRDHWLKKFETPSKKRPLETKTSPVARKKLTSTSDKLVDCPNCSKQYSLEEINVHLDKCLDVKEAIQKCPVCETSCSSDEVYATHIEKCFLKMCDDFDKQVEKLTKENKAAPCLACGKNILRSELDGHLEDCMHMSNIFDTTNVLIDDAEW